MSEIAGRLSTVDVSGSWAHNVLKWSTTLARPTGLCAGAPNRMLASCARKGDAALLQGSLLESVSLQQLAAALPRLFRCDATGSAAVQVCAPGNHQLLELRGIAFHFSFFELQDMKFARQSIHYPRARVSKLGCYRVLLRVVRSSTHRAPLSLFPFCLAFNLRKVIWNVNESELGFQSPSVSLFCCWLLDCGSCLEGSGERIVRERWWVGRLGLEIRGLGRLWGFWGKWNRV